MTDELDPIVARALRDLPVPDHGPGFWDRLDDRLAAAAPATTTRGAAAADDDALVLDADSDGDDGAPVIPLRPRDAGPFGRNRNWLLAAAAVLVVVALGVALQPDDKTNVDVAGGGAATTTVPDQTSVPGDETRSPSAAVLAWLDAVGAGDVDTAVALTGPRTVAYIESLGGTIEGFILEAAEGYGAWSASPDRTVTEISLPEVETGVGRIMTVVVVSGTWTGEGDTGYRTDAFPVVQADQGPPLVEVNAFDPARGGRLEFTSPPPGPSGLGGLPPDGVVEVSAPGGGSFYFSIDGGDFEFVDGEHGAGTAHGTWDPPGDLTNGTHLLVVAYADGGSTFTAFAGQVTVEG